MWIPVFVSGSGRRPNYVGRVKINPQTGFKKTYTKIQIPLAKNAWSHECVRHGDRRWCFWTWPMGRQHLEASWRWGKKRQNLPGTQSFSKNRLSTIVIRFRTFYFEVTHIGPYRVLLCFIEQILGIVYGPGVSSKAVQGVRTHEMDHRRTTSPCPLLENLGWPDPHPATSLRRWLHRSPPRPLRTDPATNAVDNTTEEANQPVDTTTEQNQCNASGQDVDEFLLWVFFF